MVEFLLGWTLIGMLIASVVLWWRLYNAQSNQRPHALTARDLQLPPLGFLDLIVVFVIQMFFQSVGIGIVLAITNTTNIDFDNTRQMTAFNLIVGALSIVAAIASLAWLWGRYRNKRAAGLVPEAFTRDLKLGFIAFLLFIPPTLILQSVLVQFWDYEHPTMDMISPDSPLLSMVSACLMACIVAPLNEEVIFRVVLLGWLLRCFANPRDALGGLLGGTPSTPTSLAQETDSIATVEAVLIAESSDDPDADLRGAPARDQSNPYAPPANTFAGFDYSHRRTWLPLFIIALLFSVAHIGQGPAPIPIFFLGFALCLLYRQTGSLVPCVITHFLLNTFSMTVFTIQQFFAPPEEEVVPELAGTIGTLIFHLYNFAN